MWLICVPIIPFVRKDNNLPTSSVNSAPREWTFATIQINDGCGFDAADTHNQKLFAALQSRQGFITI